MLIMRILLSHTVFVIYFLTCTGIESPIPRICIVGAGMGGSSAAHYLRQHYGDEVQIDVYESGTVGGRLATISLDNRQFESGGSIIHPRNQYMTNFTKLLGLRPRYRPSGGGVGLYDGEEMVFTTSDNAYLTIAKLLWHYGLSVISLEDFVEHSLNMFDRIYKHQEEGYAFTTPEKLLASMSPAFVSELQQTIDSYLSEREFYQTFIDQFVMSALLTNYGQSTDIHAFVGMVALGGIQPGLWSVHGGNKMVPTQLLQRSKVNLVEAKVNKVLYLPDGKYSVSFETTGGASTAEYDIVILATPLEVSKIQLENLPPGSYGSGKRKFHRTVANFVHGQLNASYFGLSSAGDLTKAILSTNPKTFFNSIGLQESVDLMPEEGKSGPVDLGRDAVWKVFSKKPLEAEELHELFVKRDEVKVVDWMAYPSYTSRGLHDPLPRFELNANLYYVNAVEWGASAMETVSIAGRNAALLAINRWQGSVEMVDRDLTPGNTRKVEL